MLTTIHNKQEHPPMHSAEHILNQTMIRMFGCERSKNSHIERKKSKIDYILDSEPSKEKIQEIENEVNRIISLNLPVTIEFSNREDVKDIVDLSKLPEDATETLRIVKIGDYDICACIGQHVENTSEIGTFKFLNYDFSESRLRLRYKVI